MGFLGNLFGSKTSTSSTSTTTPYVGTPYYPNLSTARGSTLTISPGVGGSPIIPSPGATTTPVTPVNPVNPAVTVVPGYKAPQNPTYFGDNTAGYFDILNQYTHKTGPFAPTTQPAVSPTQVSATPTVKYDVTSPVPGGMDRVPYPGYQGVGQPGIPGNTYKTFDSMVNIAPIAAQMRDQAAAALMDQYGQVQGEINAIPGLYAPIMGGVQNTINSIPGLYAPIENRTNQELNTLTGPNSPYNQISQAVTGDIAGLKGDIGKLTGSIEGDINLLRSEINPFVQATVQPLQQQLAETQAQATRDFARRGIFGTLSEQGVQNATLPLRQEIARQQTLATQSALGEIEKRQGLIGDLTLGSNQQVTQMRSLMGQLATDQYNSTLSREQLLTNIQGGKISSTLAGQQLLSQIQGNALEATLARQGLLTDINKSFQNISQQELTSELAGLGLQQNAIDQVLKSMYPGGSSTSGTNTAPNTGQGLGSLLFGIGSLAALGPAGAVVA